MLRNPYQDIEEQIRLFRPMVKRIAGQIASRLPASVMLDDLIQEGMMGFLDALHKFKPQPKMNFEAYASMRIRGAIYDACRRDDLLPRHQRDKVDELERISIDLERKLQRPATELEICTAAGMDLSTYRATLENLICLLPIDEVPEDALPSSTRDDPFEYLSQKQWLAQVVNLIAQLPEKQQMVLALHYQEDLSYREIAAVLELTPGRISQLHTQAMIQMRAWMKPDQNLPSKLPLPTMETPPSGE